MVKLTITINIKETRINLTNIHRNRKEKQSHWRLETIYGCNDIYNHDCDCYCYLVHTDDTTLATTYT